MGNTVAIGCAGVNSDFIRAIVSGVSPLLLGLLQFICRAVGEVMPAKCIGGFFRSDQPVLDSTSKEPSS